MLSGLTAQNNTSGLQKSHNPNLWRNIEVLDDFDTQIQCEEFYGYVPDEEDYEPYDPEEELDEDAEDWGRQDDLPYEDDEDSYLIDEHGGLTAEGYALLADLDRQGFFV